MPATQEIEAVLGCLTRLQECSPPLDAGWLARLRAIAHHASSQPDELWAALNSKSIWGGAESLASQALNSDTGYDPAHWRFQVRMFRELMIELGELLQAHGRSYPDIDAWLLAFNNWNNANV